MAGSSRNPGRNQAHGGDAPGGDARGGMVAPVITGLASAAAITAAIALLLYTGLGFLRTAGMLVGVTLLALAAGVWAGDDDSRSTRLRTLALLGGFVAGDVFSAYWAASEPLRSRPAGGALAVLLLLAVPAYLTGTLIAGLQRHAGRDGTRSVGVEALAGAAIGVFVATTFLISRYDAWVIFFGAAILMLPGAAYPAVRGGRERKNGGPMSERVVIVTGVGSAGQLGYALARHFIDAGARVIITGRRDDVRSLAESLGGRNVCQGVRADLTSQTDIDGVIRAAAAWGRLDALVNTAGGLSVTGTVADTDADAFAREMTRNAETVLLMSRAALPMLRQSRGAIINFASPAVDQTVQGLGAYTAAKAAVIALTRSMALEESVHGVRVNAIAPGMIDTQQNRAESSAGTHFVTRDEVADAVLFLAGEGGRGVTGETLRVRGQGPVIGSSE
jgi:NAD(P)-dependent dehydrogenase (short-subunit alcohol dehydrogenase family)